MRGYPRTAKALRHRCASFAPPDARGCSGKWRAGQRTERAQLRRLLNSLAAGDIVIDAARSASALDPRPVEHTRGHHRKKECGSVSGPPSLVEPAQHFFDCVRGAAAGLELDQPGYSVEYAAA